MSAPSCQALLDENVYHVYRYLKVLTEPFRTLTIMQASRLIYLCLVPCMSHRNVRHCATTPKQKSMNQLDSLRSHALYVNDGHMNGLMVETARKALNDTAMSVLDLPRDAACGEASLASQLQSKLDSLERRSC